ncbi:uncharacterized protein BDR25DRAFT_49536 [Lindgomyces ingoldianus]|uniref:Uncharacterized protein n=1 Tax=Lindgomyces ingoldianus TaxID=673940 RepID=A0ACB6QR19_9PLEO|nr:uncharacterized protein BDR25DRAFT_49536 [Lindgomyces ingoldianus]KAF2469439.1 hypothetical protein BDR25DRAFT_49536 [Lindgomyces ingoldianus]
MAGPRSLNPTCEDYHSDDSDIVESFRRSPATNQANVTAKRSHPSDLGTDQPAAVEKVVNIDMQSDSGYSSHTAATMSSADSAPSAKSQSPPVAILNSAPLPPPSPATIKKRPALGEERKSSSQNSPRKPLQRTGSVSSRTGRSRKATNEECNDPNCTKCGPNARGRRPAPSPLDSGLDLSYVEPRSQRTEPSYAPQSPTYTTRRLPLYPKDSAVVQPAQTAPRRSLSMSRPARPVSFHGGDSTSGYLFSGMPYPTPPHERGPPPSASATFTMQMPPPQMGPYGMMSATPPNYFPPMSLQTSPPYDSQRPPMQARTPSNYNPRPVSQYGPPLVTYEQSGNMPSARHPTAPQSARYERFPQSTFESESSEEELSEEENFRGRHSRALMPPPKAKPVTARRPSVHRASTNQVYNNLDRMSQSQQLPERPRERDSHASRLVATAAPSRATSTTRRPSIKQKSQSSYETPQTQVFVEDARSRRRQSYMGPEKELELKAKHRDSKIFQSDRDDVLVSLGHRRRKTDLDPRRREEHITETKERQNVSAAEAYQQRMRGSEAPLTEQAHKAAKRNSRILSGPSDNGSSRSRSDKASRISQSNRTTMTSSGGNGEVRLRVDPSMGLRLQLNGDNEGRTIQFEPAEDGMADIVISGPRGSENAYRSEMGSISGRKAIMGANSTRREAEELSTRSTRSSHGRREDGRRPLRRTRQIEYEN